MKSRVITALAVMPAILAAVCYRLTWPLMVIGGLVVLVGGMELARLAGRKLPPLLGLLFFLLMGTLTVLGHVRSSPFAWLLVFWLTVGAIAASRLLREPVWPLLELASLWIAAPVLAIVFLHAESQWGVLENWHWQTLPLMLLLPLWAGDTAAIFVGMSMGKHPLAPNISPKKSVEGAIANLAAAIAVAVPLGAWLGVSWQAGLACGIAVGVLGQAGDLFESWLKRRAGVKDSGAILPGHGGVLDRVDSLLFAAPVVTVILLYT